MLLLLKLLPLSLFAALARLGGLLLTALTAVVTGGQASTVTTSSFYVFLENLAKTRRTMSQEYQNSSYFQHFVIKGQNFSYLQEACKKYQKSLFLFSKLHSKLMGCRSHGHTSTPLGVLVDLVEERQM